MKNLILALVFTFVSTISFSQEIKGFSFHSKSYVVVGEEYQRGYIHNQIYNVSFSDSTMILERLDTNNNIYHSKKHKIKSYAIIENNFGVEILFSVIYGGKINNYTLHIKDEYIVLTMNDEKFIYSGDINKIEKIK